MINKEIESEAKAIDKGQIANEWWRIPLNIDAGYEYIKTRKIIFMYF